MCVRLIQDADLEYDPRDIPALYERYLRGDVEAVYGSRIQGASQRRSSFFFYWGGRVVSLVASALYGAWVTDHRLQARRDEVAAVTGATRGFDFCPELTARLLRRGGRIAEVPIRYEPRTWAEGKKITARDGLLAIWVLLRERLG